MASERDLGQAIDAIAADLGPACDWQKRIAAMERIDGLLAGGAADYSSAFDANLRSLRDPLTRQVLDRSARLIARAGWKTQRTLGCILAFE